MPFNGSLTAVQQYPNTSRVLFTDTSSGSDPNITGRRLYPRNAAGQLVLPTGNTLGYIDWPLPLATPLLVDLLPKDIALNIQCVWISSSPLPSSVYDVILLSAFTKNIKRFLYERTQDLAAYPSVSNDKGFVGYYIQLQSEVDTAELAVTPDILDISDAQGAIDRSYYIIKNQNNFF